MPTLRSLLGYQVSQRDGLTVGVVSDVIVDYQASRVLAFLLHHTDGELVLPLDAVYEYAPPQLIVNNADDLSCLAQLPHVQQVWAQRFLRLGQTELTAEGQRLGLIRDVHFDFESGAVEYFEIVNSELSEKWVVMIAPEEIEPKGRAILASPYIAETLRP